MKYLIIILLLFSGVLYGQELPKEFEIFYMSVEHRDNITDDFAKEKFESVIGIWAFTTEEGKPHISIRGSLKTTVYNSWEVTGEIKIFELGDFKQLVFHVIDSSSKTIGIVSFMVGPFNFNNEIYLPTKEPKFEATILMEKARYTFVGIF